MCFFAAHGNSVRSIISWLLQTVIPVVRHLMGFQCCFVAFCPSLSCGMALVRNLLRIVCLWLFCSSCFHCRLTSAPLPFRRTCSCSSSAVDCQRWCNMSCVVTFCRLRFRNIVTFSGFAHAQHTCRHDLLVHAWHSRS